MELGSSINKSIGKVQMIDFANVYTRACRFLLSKGLAMKASSTTAPRLFIPDTI